MPKAAGVAAPLRAAAPTRAMTNPIDRDAARADCARLLAAAYYQPGPEFAEERLFDSVAAAAAQVDAELGAAARELAAAFAAADPQALLIDYTRLFIGPERAVAQPYGSVWVGGEPALMQESTLAVMTLYAQAGFAVAEDFRDLPDHVAVELEFLYLLLFRTLQAARQNDAATAAQFEALRRRLLDEHLSRWIEPFTQAVQVGAATPVYATLARLTAEFVRREAASAAPQ